MFCVTKMKYIVPLLFIIHSVKSNIQYTKDDDVFFDIVGIFDQKANIQLRAFNESMATANFEALRLTPLLVNPDKTDSYSVLQKFCTVGGASPIAIFGPQNPVSDGAIRDYCANMNIPHLQATYQPNDSEMYLGVVNETEEFKKISINFYPDADEISQAYAELLKYYSWESFAVLYEDDYGFMRIQKMLALHTEKHPVTVRRLDPSADNQKVFKDIKKYQESRILVDCHVDNVLKYMLEAKALDMLNFYQHYILVTMDAHIIAEELTQYQSNITWLSMFEYEKLDDSQHFLAGRIGQWMSDQPGSPPVTSVKTESLLMHDVSNHVLKSLKNVSDIITKHELLPCGETQEVWSDGVIMQKQILTTMSHGVSGKIQFNEVGKRTNYTLFVNEIHVSKLKTVGRWNSSLKGSIEEDRDANEDIVHQKSSKKFIVISRKAKPYFFKKEVVVPTEEESTEESTEDSTEAPEEEDDGLEYEGFSVDLIKAIFKIMKDEMNLNYTFEFSKEEHVDYGVYNPTEKKWNGLIGELLDKSADLAICDLTITEERKKVVDFSVPIMSLGISILFTKEQKIPPATFSFLNPFSFELWMYTATAYCVVSIVLFICSRISPADWENPQPCDKEPEELENIWNFKNCTWLTMGSIMTQGCDILPKAIGSRWVCSMWWFFAMIVCQTYIAQLAASLTSNQETPLTSVEDLANQNKILYGALKSGSTLEFFKNSKDKMYKRIYDNMIANPVVLVRTNEEGENRVKKGNNKYAFFMESSTIEYKKKRNCNLKQVGGELDSKDYGIAMPANSPFRSPINRAILRLKELTKLDEIKNKWWNQKYGAKECEEKKNDDDVEGDLEMQNLMGVFYVLIVGIVISLFITAAEFMNEVRNIVVREEVTHREAIEKELRASLNFFRLQKPVLRNASRASSVISPDDIEKRKQTRADNLINFLDLEKIQP